LSTIYGFQSIIKVLDNHANLFYRPMYYPACFKHSAGHL